MSDHGNRSPTVACPICHERKSWVQHDLVCGTCISRESELIRNSVIENEELNSSMREQIDTILAACHSQIADKDANVKNANAHELPTENENRPEQHIDSVRPLALSLQKLAVMNLNMKSQGLQRSCDLLGKKNQALEQKIETLSSRLETNRLQIHLREKSMLEEYSRRLECLDREIVSVQYERLRRTLRHATLEQYASYKVIREHYFSMPKVGEISQANNLQLCERPVLQLAAFTNTQIVTVNTFLEDLIKLILLLHQLSSMRNGSFELPYLDYLKSLLPEQSFYESVQTKLDSILHHNQNTQGVFDEAEATQKENNMEILSENTSNISLSPIETDKITIVDRKIRVPRSFRTMNSQRRSSIKEADIANINLSSETNENIHKEPTRQHNLLPENISPKSSVKSQQRTEQVRQAARPSISQTSPNNHHEDPQEREKVLTGKRIVIIPHRILSKPFAKLQANDYLRFLSIVVKILVVYNAFLRQALGSLAAAGKEKKLNSFSLFSQRTEAESSVSNTPNHKPRFIYDFRELLWKIANLDSFFQNELKPGTVHEIAVDHGFITTQASHSIEGSRATITGKDTPLGNSAVDSKNPVEETVLPNSTSIFSGLYAMFGAKNRSDAGRRDSTSATDKAIYGMVSETITQSSSKIKEHKRSKNKKEISTEDRENNSDFRYPQFDLKHISRAVHSMISGHGHGNGNGGAAHMERVGANPSPTMQQSTSQLDDWDVVSKMF